ncbi:hypothetical protein WICMUC_003399 [Wickerhamomyces mucosus]|uniref:DNA damage checkpoint protein LCD1 n=1 Tax=Wickerhamomyces mucosus TaxID=1378264 RepID=A0A9P8PLP6_9ASCO|nr:hypothetical protein WICMUC_003399 [Wickerhamomyces mucosus]
MDLSEDDSFDDDDELLELTKRPPRRQTQPYTQISNTVSNKTNEVIDLTQNELLSAKGQVAVLKSRIEQLERAKRSELESLNKANQIKSNANISRIHALEEQVKRLEDDKRFMSTEMKSLRMHNKRRKKVDDSNNSTNNNDVEMEDAVTTSAPPIQTFPTTPIPSVPISTSKQQHQPTRIDVAKETIQLKFTSAKYIEENSLFIDYISNYTAAGLESSVIDVLDNICIDDQFKDDNNKYQLESYKPIKPFLSNFLSEYKKVYRLDEFLSRFIKLLINLIRFVMKDVTIIKDFSEKKSTSNDNRFKLISIPFLISLVHGSLNYRPKAILDENLIDQVLIFSVNIIKQFNHLIKPLEFDEFHFRNKKLSINSIQYEFLEALIFIFTNDLFETVLVNNVHTKHRNFVKSFLTTNYSGIVTYFKSVFSVYSSINVMFSVASTLDATINIWEDDIDHDFPISNQDLIKSLTNLIFENIPIHRNWLVHGLNRCIGNNCDEPLIQQLIPQEVRCFPNPIHPLEHNEFKLNNRHEEHSINLSFKILQFLEKSILYNFNNSKFDLIDFLNSDFTVLKNLILSISKLQELNFLHPRSNLSYLRCQLISQSVKVLHLIWELTILNHTGNTDDMNDEAQIMSPNLTPELSFELIIVLARISFNNDQTSNEAVKFLIEFKRKYQSKYKDLIFDKFANERFENINYLKSVDYENDFEVFKLVQTQMNFPNGLEFQYDYETIELSRDILSKFLTPDDSDNLFVAINANEEIG